MMQLKTRLWGQTLLQTAPAVTQLVCTACRPAPSPPAGPAARSNRAPTAPRPARRSGWRQNGEHAGAGVLPKTSRLACAASGHVNVAARPAAPLRVSRRHQAPPRGCASRVAATSRRPFLAGGTPRGCGGWEAQAGVASRSAVGGGGGGLLQGAPAMSLGLGSGAHSDAGPIPRAAALPVSCRASPGRARSCEPGARWGCTAVPWQYRAARRSHGQGPSSSTPPYAFPHAHSPIR